MERKNPVLQKVRMRNLLDVFYWLGLFWLICTLLKRSSKCFYGRRFHQKADDRRPTFESKQGLNEKKVNVGWVLDGHLKSPIILFEQLSDSVKMRVGNIARWINMNSVDFYNTLYDPSRRYDLVVFFKTMGDEEQCEVRKIQAYGGKVIFDANVNYYELWGNFDQFSNKTTKKQQENAIKMTSMVDCCVGDSTKICEKAGKFNSNTFWVPDNVDLDIFRFVKRHSPVSRVKIIWSGISFKANHLLFLKDVFKDLKGAELVLVSEKFPSVINELEQVISCRYVPYSDQGYARILSKCDIIISPKQLINSYEIGHTEYKIALGMAAGLPVVASPQQSYIEAISVAGGGIIAEKEEAWLQSLQRLVIDHTLRSEMGQKARLTIVEHYSLPEVAQKYLKAFKKCLSM